MPARVRRATIQAGVGLVGSTSRTMRTANSDAPTRPRMGLSSWTATAKPETGSPQLAPQSVAGVAEGRARRVRVLARDAAHRQRVPAVGRDVDVDRDVVEAEERDRVGADGRSMPRSTRRRMPECSSPRPSSFAEAIMPSETWP